MPRVLVHTPGFQTTVQDLGRPGYAHLGISASGAADALSLRLGNRLLGNPEGAAALEMTLTGGSFEFDRDTRVVLAGSDFGLPPWTVLEVKAGQTLACASTRGGARCYLCVAGGIDVPPAMGSRSTHLLTALGGFEGRALRAGDVLGLGAPGAARPIRLSPALLHSTVPRGVLRVTDGPQRDWFPGSLEGASYRVAEESNRMGLRLEGPVVEVPRRQLLTEGAALGAVQIPPSGQPIILFVEHQTTGGYPKIANVIAADLHVLGQLRPRDEVRFERVSLARARGLLLRQESQLNIS